MTSEGLTKETLGLRLPLFRIPIAAASNVFGVVRKRAPRGGARRGVRRWGAAGGAPRFSYLNPKHP